MIDTFKNGIKNNIKNSIKKSLSLSVLIIIITSIASIIISSLSQNRLSFDYIFISNFAVGAFILLAGLVQYSNPIWMKKSKLIDHTTYKDILIDKREEKKRKANEILITGISIILIVGIIEILVSFVL